MQWQDGQTAYVCEALNDDEMTQVVRLFRAQRRRMGVEDSDEAWFSGPLDDWLACLNGTGEGLERESVAGLAVGMREKLAFRDALIVSLVCAGARRGELLELGARPHRPGSVAYLSRALGDAFRDPKAVPDETRCERGLYALAQIVRAVPADFRVQPMAVIAYVLWWMGDPRAVAYAALAAAGDGRCNLALIVLSAAERGIAPAWTVGSGGGTTGVAAGAADDGSDGGAGASAGASAGGAEDGPGE